MRKNTLFIYPLICLTLVSHVASARWFGGAFLRALLFNSNVYKTRKDIKTGGEVYYLGDHSILDGATTPTIKVPNVKKGFVRYRILKDADKTYIKLLPGLHFNKATNEIVPGPVSSSDPRDYPENYIFKVDFEKDPAKQYLASSKISGMPLLLPLKYRLQGKNNSATFNYTIAYSFGYKIKCGNNPYRDRYIDLAVAVGLGQDTYVPTTSIDDRNFKGTSELIFTKAIGVAYEFNSTNFGIFYGSDNMFGAQKDWYYQNKPWLSLGFGYKFGK